MGAESGPCPSLLAPARQRGFVMIGTARSGSSLLRSALQQHPSLRVYDELLSFQERHRDRLPSRLGGHRFRDNDDGYAFLARVYDSYYGAPVVAVGYKMLLNHGHQSAPARRAWLYLANRQDLQVLFLVRNPVHSWISAQVEQMTGQWNIPVSAIEEPHDIAPFNVDARALREFLDDRRRLLNWVQQLLADKDQLSINYSGLCDDWDTTTQEIQRFLRIPARRLTRDFKRLASKSPREQILNYDELAAKFSHSPYRQFFTE